MRRAESRTSELDDVIRRFQAEIRQLALTAARAVVEEELARRRARSSRGRSRGRRPAPPPAGQLELGFTQLPQRQLELPLARAAEGAGSSDR